MYNDLKTQLSELLGISKDALHIHLGLAIFIIAAVMFRRGFASWIPWLILLAFELFNEFMDIFHIHEGVMGLDIGGSAKDVVNTMIWPTVVFVVARARRARDGSRLQSGELPPEPGRSQ
jgi:hypothetical protein